MSRRRLITLLVAAAQATDIVEGGTTCLNAVSSNYRSVSLIQATTKSRRAAATKSRRGLEKPFAEDPATVRKQEADHVSQETWRSLLEARAGGAGHLVSHSVERALGASTAALATRGIFDATIIIMLVVIGGACCLLWHNNWSVQGAVDDSREMAGKAAGAAKKGTHAAAVRIEKVTRDRHREADPGASSSAAGLLTGVGSPLGSTSNKDSTSPDRSPGRESQRAGTGGQESARQASRHHNAAEATECC
uniref:Uncharacterized protein n=1 Tax=Alexandrium catenella TaxID=2925 RepID=A0A7S1W057_ALECA|mmetsp:Transcript_34204/g.92593  ORF Transcript_34204/g.92593 Transcript_34204/m.92593 type:complete len:249 (+) Transcript_34204:86-832(+)